MSGRKVSLVVIAAVLGGANAFGDDSDGANLVPGGSANGDPKAECNQSPALCFEWPRLKKGVAYAGVRSKPFFAIILRSGKGCTVPESDRLAAQGLFPTRKVFARRSFDPVCPEAGDREDDVTYSNVSPDHSLLALHAGEDRKGAQKVLAEVAKTGRFPGANLRKMEVRVAFP